MGSDAKAEIAKLLSEGKSPTQARIILENRGYSTDDVAEVLSQTPNLREQATADERKNSRYLSVREVFDRIGYGGASPQFVNIMFWLSQQTHPFILALIGVLNGLKTVISVTFGSIMHEYGKLHKVSKNTIAAAGVIFGFSFLFMSFGLLMQNIVLFSAAFLIGTAGLVVYGDLYQKFVRETIRRERMSGFLRSIAHWGVLITAVTFILAGFLLDRFPMTGVTWNVFGHGLKVYGYLLAFEITAFAFIIGGYVSSLVVDKREDRSYAFGQFIGEHFRILKHKLNILSNKYVLLLALASLISGFLQIIITAYSGIAIYQLLSKQYTMPFLVIATLYAIAIVASFLGPFFTERLHHSTGLAPTLVFGSLIAAIFPLVLVYRPHVVTIGVSLCLYVIGSAITGYAQGVLAQKLMDEETRTSYFQMQSVLVVIPYLVLIPVMAFAAVYFSLNLLFMAVAVGSVALVMPLYFVLVLLSQKVRL